MWRTAHYNVNRPYTTNGLNQLTSAGATALAYDGRGNLTTSGTNTYGYTSENRLATGPNGVTLYYDPTGRLSRLTQAAATTKFDYLGPRLMIERNATGTVLRRYVHGPGDDEPLVWYEGTGLTNKRWLHTDERGSVIAVSDASGSAIATNRYNEYGIPQSTNAGRFQYTGQTWLAELGLYYYKARMYSPTLGRFMQTDPIGYKEGVNWYAYVDDDPVNGTDPSGLCLEDACIGEGAVAACLSSQACTAGAVAIGAGIVYYGGKLIQAVGTAISQPAKPTTATPRATPSTTRSAAGAPPPDPNDREKAKDRRERQQQEARDQRARRSGGEPDTGGAPRNPQAQNRGFDSVVKNQRLTPDQANKLHQEITGKNMDRNEILQRAKEMFPK